MPRGQYHRAYTGGGFTPPASETISCPGGGIPDTETIERLWLVAGSEDGALTVSPDGKQMIGKVGGGADEDKWEWNFKAIKGP